MTDASGQPLVRGDSVYVTEGPRDRSDFRLGRKPELLRGIVNCDKLTWDKWVTVIIKQGPALNVSRSYLPFEIQKVAVNGD